MFGSCGTSRCGRWPVIRIMHVITGLQRGGAEIMLCRLIKRADRTGFRHTVVSLTDVGVVGRSIEGLGVPVSTLGMRRSIQDFSAIFQLAAVIRRDAPHVVQTWLYHADLVGLLAAKVARARVVVWNVQCSDMDMRRYRWTSRWTRRMLATLSRAPAAVVVNSEAGRRAHERLGYRPRRWVMIPNAVDLERFRPDPEARESVRRELGLPLDARLVGMVARYDPMKDHETFLRAAAILIREGGSDGGDLGESVHFVLVGRGVVPDNRPLATVAHELRLDGRLHLLGERRDVQRLFPAMDIVTLSSSFGEGWPNVIGEAMACAVPCAVTDVGDCAAIVGPTGRVVPPRDPRALADAWRALLALREEERRGLGAAARQRVAEYFSLEQVTRRYEALYTELAAARR